MYEMVEADNAWDMSQTRILYEAEVPEMEKKPFRLFIDKRKIDKLEVKVFKDEKGLFVGFVIALIYADIVMIDYFEVNYDHKEAKVEPEFLEKIKEILPGARMLLVCSQKDGNLAENYKAAGYKKADYAIGLGDITQDIYVSENEADYVGFEELIKVYENVYGTFVSGVISKV